MLPALILTLSLCAQEPSSRTAVAIPEQAAPGTDAELRLHDASGLTGHPGLEAHVRWLAGRGLAGGAARAAYEKLDRLRRQVSSTTEGLLEAIREDIDPPLSEQHRLEHVGGGSLALLGTHAQQAWLEGFLDGAASVAGLIDIETLLYLVPAGDAAARYAGRNGEVLSASAGRDVLVHLDASEADKIIAPRVLVHPFSKASLSALDEVSYVKDFEFKVLPDRSGEVADPIIGVVHDGVTLEVRPVPQAGGKLLVHADLTYQKLGRPIPSLETTLGRLQIPVTIQLPEVTRVRAAGRFDLAPGETVLLTSDTLVEGERAVVLLRVSTVLEQSPSAGERR